MDRPIRISRFLIPNEHGAWGMFLTSFCVGWLAAPELSWRPLFLLPAAVGLFFVRYPVGIIFKKRRIARALRIELVREKRSLALYVPLAVLATIPLFYPLGWWWLLPIGAAAAATLALHLRDLVKRRERTFLSEASAMVGLSLLAPTASLAATGIFSWETAAVWIGLVAFYLWRITTVRRKVARKKEEPVDFRAVGWREVVYSSLWAVALIVTARIVYA